MAVTARKRPWYLVLALWGALALGATGACSGWNTVALYHEPVDATAFGQNVADPADRAVLIARVSAYLDALDHAKPRAWPLAVAALVLGCAVLIAALRAMRGSGSARTALVQILVAQAMVHAASFWLTRDVLDADLRLIEASQTADLHSHFSDRTRADDAAATASRLLRVATPIEMALRTLGTALIIVALTRRRSREYLEASKEAIGGR